MIEKTISESLFENLCRLKNIKCISIETDPTKQTPDYDIFTDNQKIVVEIKEVELNEKEIKIKNSLKQKRRVAYWASTGVRVRNKIDSAHIQLRNRARGQHPSILILYDNTSGFANLDDDDFLIGMYGSEACSIRIPYDPDNPFQQIDLKFGGKRRLTRTEKRYISALGRLNKGRNGRPLLTIYHNIFADIALDPYVTSKLAARQLKIKGTEKFQEWEEIIIT